MRARNSLLSGLFAAMLVLLSGQEAMAFSNETEYGYRNCGTSSLLTIRGTGSGYVKWYFPSYTHHQVTHYLYYGNSTKYIHTAYSSAYWKVEGGPYLNEDLTYAYCRLR